jgi:hypothetical protein
LEEAEACGGWKVLALVPEKGVRNGLLDAEAMAKINADYPDTLVCSNPLKPRILNNSE